MPKCQSKSQLPHQTVCSLMNTMHLSPTIIRSRAINRLVVSTIIALLSLNGFCRAEKAKPFVVKWGPGGLTSLKSGETEFIVDGDPQMTDLRMSDGEIAPGDFEPQKSEFSVNKQALAKKFAWGLIEIDYVLEGRQFEQDITVTNTGTRPLSRVTINLMKVVFPALPDGVDWSARNLMSIGRDEDLPVIMADWHQQHVALCCDKLDEFAKFGYNPDGETPFNVFVTLDGTPIGPGQSRRTRISFRIGSGDKPWKDVDDICRSFAEKYPSELKWPDRRPIGSAFLATSVAGYKNNPRGWFLDQDLDTSTSQGQAKFRNELNNYANAVIQHCKQMNAQGVIVWDLEGQEMPHATSYLADPRMLAKVAPEMDAVADGFMRKFSDAGLRTGITLRPTRVAPNDHGPGWMQQDVADQPAELEQKLEYANKRWGCTLFYCDSNVDFVKDATGKVLSDPAMPAADFKKLAAAHKDCLIIPEHHTSAYWAYTAPYMEYRLGFAGTSGGVLEAYPHAFSVLRVVDGPSLSEPDSVRQLSASIRNGDILLFRPWWDDPQTADIANLYKAAASASRD